MTLAESGERALPRGVGVLLVLVGAGLLSLALLLVGLLRGGRTSWALVGMALLLSLKALLALVGGIRLVQNGGRPMIRPVEWRALGVGYCLVAALLVAAALAGEGWGYAFAAALFGGLAPAWFAVARHSESGLTKSHAASDSNTAAAGDSGR